MKYTRRLIKYIIGLLRLLSFAIIVAFYLLILPLSLVFVRKSKRSDFVLAYRGLMARTLFIALGLKVSKKGNSPKGPCLLVSNHRSYVDPAPTTAFTPALPLAKKEISSWPLIGLGVKMTGILFVDRDDASSRRASVMAMEKAWKENKVILNYPEGTTHNQVSTLPFNKGAFKAALSAGVPIIPMCIEYGRRSDAWIGDDTFMPHFIRCFGKWQTRAYLEFGEPIVENSVDETIVVAREWIDLRLELYAKYQK